jgi:AcrR family transcriptional regulator
MNDLERNKPENPEDLLQSIREFFENFPEEWIPPDDPEHPKVKIMDAARELFAAKGFKGAGLREIASKADVNQAMINYYYSSKELLYRRVLVAQMYEMFRTMITYDEDDINNADFIATLSARIIDGLRKKPLYAHLFIREISDGGATFKKIIQELGYKGPVGFRQLVIRRYKAGVEEGSLRDLDINVVAMMNITLAYCFLFVDSFFSQITGISAQDDEVWKHMRRTMIDIFSHGLLTK